MTATALAAHPHIQESFGAAPLRLIGGAGERPTLEDLISSVWEGLSASASVSCPVCSGEMTAHAGAGGGSCRSCGSTLD